MEEIRLRRSKIGFEVPEAKWLKEVSERILEYINSAKRYASDYLNIDDVQKMIKDLRAGKISREISRLLWRALFICSWLKVFKEFSSRL